MRGIKNSFAIGVDIGEAGLRIAQLRDAGGRLEVHRAVSWEHAAAESNAEGAKADAARISHLMAQYGFAGKRAITGLTVPVLEHHLLELPPQIYDQAPAEISKAVQFEINRLSNQERGLQIGSWALPRSKRSKSTFMGVAATREQVCARLDVLEEAGLECVRIDVVDCALASFINHLRGIGVDDVWGVMDVGYYRTRLAVCMKDRPVLVRGIDMGGQSWTEKVAERLGLSRPSAERYKRDFGLSGGATAAQAPSADEALLTEMACDVLKDDVGELSGETERSFEYILQSYPGMAPGPLVLVGGGSCMTGLADVLAGNLGIAVRQIGDLDTPATRTIVEGLSDTASLEVVAQACALSFQGTIDA